MNMNIGDLGVIYSMILGFSTLLITLMLFFRHIKEKKYDEVTRRVELEKLRALMEHRIYELQDRLLSTPDRWRDVNHLILDSQRVSGSDKSLKNKDVPMTSFLRDMGFTSSDIEVDPRLVFVLTPFHDQYQDTFKIIREVCSDVGLVCVRGDEVFVDSDILSHVLRQLVRARIVIANINGRNSNVFYELGIAHALGKPTILVSQSLENVPFDVRSRRILLYKQPPQLSLLLREELTKTLVGTKQ